MNYSSTKKSKIFSTLLLSIFLIQTFVQPVYAYLTYSPVVIYNPYEPLFSPLSADDILVSPSFTNASRISNEEIVVHENQEETFNSVKKKENVEKIQIEKVITPASTIAFIASEDTYGWIGNHPSKGADDPSDNLFSFQLSEKDFHQKQMVLKAEVKGVANTSGLAISINENISTGGYYISKNSDWNTIEIPMDTRQLRVGTNHIMFSLPAHATAAYEIKNPQLVFKDTPSNTLPYALVDGHHLYVKDGKAYIKGYLFDRNVSVYIEGVLAKKTGSYFEAFVPANEQTQFLTIEIQSSSETQQYQHAIKHISLVNQSLPVQAKPSSIAIQKAMDEEYWEINTEELQFKIHPDDYAKIADIQVSKLRAIDVPALGQNIINVTAHAPAYRFLPEGAVFNKEVGLTLSYDPQKLPKGYTEKDIQILYFNVDQRRWLTIPTDTIHAEQHFITGLTNHFTDYIAGVIQAPESPETNSFTPTSISDIQVANPVANIVQIEPPTANQKGDANVQFPFTLPPGRNGLQPSLGLSYNNNGSSGIAGYGWDLSIPSITVDTKFGVPAFDAATESETYLFNGEELLLKNGSSLYLSHREANAIPRVSNATFYPKVEGNFSKIQRLGTSPSNYSWVVYDKSGMKYYYGNTNDSKIATANGKISKWFLNKVEDKDGNYITYSYFIKNYSTGNLSGGKELLLSHINYTLNDNIDYEIEHLDKMVHRVDFIYKNNIRPDATINYRNGFKEVNGSYLDIINVYSSLYRNKLRGEHEIVYQFNYNLGQFNKWLLQSIDTKNRKLVNGHELEEEEVYTHEFEYYNDIQQGLFSNSEPLHAPKDLDVNALGIDMPLTELDMSMLSSTIDKNIVSTNADVGAGVTVPVFPDTYVPVSFAGTINFSLADPVSVSSSPVIQLVDIDGDGLADKVVKTNEGLKFRKNIGGTHFSQNLYDIINMDDISKSRTITKNGPVFSVSAYVANISFSGNESISETSTFLTDANADGLIDYVKDKKVYFGKIDPNSGLPTFTTNSLETPNVIYKEGQVDTSILNELPDLSLGNDLMDAVKVWVAPKSGTINITGTITKNFLGIENGIRYSIEKSSNRIFKLSEWLNIDDFGYTTKIVNTNLAPVTHYELQNLEAIKVDRLAFNYYLKEPTLMVSDSQPTNISNVSVSKGDMIFFRVNNSQVPIENSQVTWDPEITYITENFDSPNGYKQYSSKYSDTFIYGNSLVEPLVINESGTYTLSWDNFTINNSNALPELSDDVFIKVYLYRHLPQTTEITGGIDNTSPLLLTQVIRRNINNIIGNPNISFDFDDIQMTNPSTFRYLKIEVEAKSQINWKKFDNKFKPRLTRAGNNEISYITPFYEVYKNQVTAYAPSNFTTAKSIRIHHNFNIANCTSEDCQNKEVYFIAKDINGKVPNKLLVGSTYYPLKIRYTIGANGTVISKHAYNPNNNTYSVSLGSTSYSTVNFSAGEKIFLEYYTQDANIATKLSNYQNNNFLVSNSNGTPGHTSYSTSNVGLYKANVFHNYNITGFGTLYRNWGQFAYKGAAPHESFTPIKRKYIGLNNLSGNLLENPTQQELQNMSDFLMNENIEEDLSFDEENNILIIDSPNFEINPDQIQAFKHFSMFLPNRATQSWKIHNKLYVKALEVSPYLRYENSDDLETIQVPTPEFSNEYGAESIIRQGTSKSSGDNISTSFGLVGASYSTNKGETIALNDYLDVNGDGYPDIIGEKIQLTSRRGGLTNTMLTNNIKFKSNSSGNGYTLSGGIPLFAVPKISVNNKVNIIMSGSMGVSGEGFNVYTTSEYTIIDINGDGIADRVSPNGTVYFNNGSQFIPSSYHGYQALMRTRSKTNGLVGGDGVYINSIGLSIPLSNFDFSAGLSGSKSDSFSMSNFRDINGDGLIDYIMNNRIYINTGTGFVDIQKNMALEEVSRTIQIAANFNLSVNIFFPILGGFGPKLGFGGGKSTTTTYNFEKVRFMDFDNDGYLDIVTSSSERNLSVAYSNIKRTNMLKSITNPTGSKIVLDYATKNEVSNRNFGNTFKMPFKKWVLSSVEIHDGYEGDGEDVQTYAFEYKNGFKDRRERKFLGFGEVYTHLMRKDGTIFRTNVQEFMLNSLTDYEAKQPSTYAGVRKHQYVGNLPVKQYTIDAIGRTLNESYTEYAIFNLSGNNPTTSFNTLSSPQTIPYGDKNRILPLVKSTKNIVYNYQGNSTNALPYISNAQFLLYDKVGNVLKYKDVEENLVVDITYHTPFNSAYILSLPKTHKVSRNNEVLRSSKTDLDLSNNIESIVREKLDDNGNHSETKLLYNELGLLTKVIYPKPEETSSEGERMHYEYIYDKAFDTFVAEILDANQYTSNTTYSNFGLVKTSTDINNNTFEYTYDASRRMKTFKSPFHTEWTIENEYNVQPSGINYAVTKHNLTDEFGANVEQILHTSSFSDGLGRIIQTKKQLDKSQICEISPAEEGYWFHVSGNVIYDEFGRSITTYLGQEEKNCTGDFYTQLTHLSHLTPSDQDKTIIDYDILDRPIQQQVVGLNAITSYEYSFGNNGNGQNNYFEKITLPEGNISLTFKDYKGRTTATRQVDTDTSQELTTYYSYSPLSELLTVTDAEGFITSYEYDKFGQKVLTDHPDNGKTVFTYNLAGQLVQLANQNLLDLGQYIEYVYSYNQLRKIIYPSHVVNYDYGSMNTTNQQINAVGRLQFIEDLTGTRTFKYGVLGEVVEEDRIITTQNSTMQFVTTSRYDAWGRLLEMEYPDGEHLTYNYNPVGQLKSIYSSDDIAYLRDVKYTFFDQPYEIVYGNDVKTTNHYDDMQRIRTMQIDRPSGNTFLHTHYTYDRNQNIVRLQNVASQHELIRMGGLFDKHYKYDKFNRLSNASGEWKGFDERHNYNLDMYYNATHGIIKKDQYHFTENPHFSGTTENSYNATYQYDFPEHPHAPSQINYANGNVTEFQYDSNGNIIYLTSNSELIIHGERSFIWDEQNRLLAVDDNNGQTISHYIYDHTGERTFKSEGGLSHAHIGGQQIYEIEDIYNYTIYPSGNIVVSPNRDEYTKHYYSNGKKVASKLARLQNRFEISGGLQTQDEGQSIVAPVRTMATMSTSNDNNYCAQQLTTILNHYVGPQWAECRAFINSVILDNLEDPCVAVAILNQHYCEENPLQPAPDPTDPEYTPEEIEQFDCLNELNLLLSELSADIKFKDDTCYTLVVGYVQTHLILEPESNACEVLHYIKENFECIKKDDGYLDNPSPIEGVEDDYMPTPPNPEVEEEEEFDESQRKPIWWYHSDHLGSSSYLTDNFGRPTHYYDQLPFGESMVEHNQSQYYGNQYKFNGKELDAATGMYYYGARYYDPRLSIFISVDPLAEQFMGWTPYHYVHQNPINLIDPTGMSAELYDDPPEEGDFKNGDTHTDSSGSWTYQNRVWYDNTGNDNNILAPIVIGDEKVSVGTQIVDSILSEINSFFDAIAADNKRMLSKVSSGPYGPLSGVGSGFSLNFNVFGNTLGFSMAGEHYKGWGGTNFYTSYSSGHDAGFWEGVKKNTSLGKFISISGTFDTYHNNGFGGSFDKGVEGYTNDVFSGYGIMGSYSRPFDPGLNRVNPKSGLYKTSIGISSPSPSIGLSRTKTIKLF